jgi:glutathione-independent formaldehyde dehydrogenase
MMVPWADFQLLKFPDEDEALEKIRDLTLLSDILPTGFHGCTEAKIRPGSTVYIAGAGPVGRCAAASAHLLGASCIIVADNNRSRPRSREKTGYEIVDTASETPVLDQVEKILGSRWVDGGVDCVGLECHGYGPKGTVNEEEAVINMLMEVVKPDGSLGIPGVLLIRTQVHRQSLPSRASYLGHSTKPGSSRHRLRQANVQSCGIITT